MAEFCCKTEPPNDAARRFISLVKNGKAGELEQLLVSNAELRAQIDSRWFFFDAPAIVLAANQKDRATIDVLLEAGADIDARSTWWAGGFGVLDRADDPDRSMADFLLERGATLDVHSAAALGEIDVLRQVLDADPELVHAPGGDGQRPLHFARTSEVAALLLDRGAEIDARCVDHRSTAAHYAIDPPHRQPVGRFLVERGAEPDLLMAAALGDADLVRRLLAAEPECLRVRVGQDAFPRGTDSVSDAGHIYQWKLRGAKWPQQVAIAFEHSDVYELLMDASPATDQLVMACFYDERERLLELAAIPHVADRVDDEGRAMIVEASWVGNVAAVRNMLDLGFDVDTFAGEGTALDRAAVRGRLELVELLLERGASTAIRNVHGGTPAGAALWGAIHFRDAEGDYPRVIHHLLAAQDCDVATRSAMLRWVAGEGSVEVAQLLLDAGASPTLTDDEGLDAAAHARRGGHHEVAALFEAI